MTPSRLLTAVLLAGLGCLLAVGVAWRPAEEAARAVISSPAPDRVAALSVLRDWDRARSEAWQRGRPRALRDLYLQGSASGRSDRALLTAYAARGLRVAGLAVQRAEVRVVTEAVDRLVLEVTDRLVGGTAVGAGHRVALPRDDWSTRRVVLVHVGEEWRVAEVRDQARPVASTDVTSRSENS